MAEGGSERIGGLHIEVTALGAEKTAQQVGNVAGAVSNAGKQAAAASPQMQRLRNAMQSVGVQAIGLAGGLGQVGSAIVAMLPGWGALAAATAFAVLKLKDYLSTASDIKAAELAKDLEKTADGFRKIVDSFGPDQRSAFEKSFDALKEYAAKRHEELVKEQKEKKWGNFWTDFFSFDGSRTSQAAMEGLVQSQKLQIELNRALDDLIRKSEEQRAKARAKAEAAATGDEAVKRYRENLEIEKERLEILKKQTEEYHKQRDIVVGMIRSQEEAASQFNDKLNIEQMQRMNGALTRIETAIRSTRR